MSCSVLALDVCCGPRSMWFDKKDSRAVFVDRREEEHEKPRKCRQNVTRIEIKPDVLADFTELPFPDETFFHVVMDPPHYTERAAGKGHILKHYGCLFPGWQEMLSEGFRECFRVLKPGGTFIFKWCEHEIPLREILTLTPHKPLYGHRTGSREKTHLGHSSNNTPNTMSKYRLLKSGEITDPKQGDQFQESPKKWVPTIRDGRLIHDGLVGAYRRPIRKPNSVLYGPK